MDAPAPRVEAVSSYRQQQHVIDLDAGRSTFRSPPPPPFGDAEDDTPLPEWIEQMIASWRASARTRSDVAWLTEQVAGVVDYLHEQRAALDDVRSQVEGGVRTAVAQAAHASIAARQAAAAVEEQSAVRGATEEMLLGAKAAAETAASAAARSAENLARQLELEDEARATRDELATEIRDHALAAMDARRTAEEVLKQTTVLGDELRRDLERLGDEAMERARQSAEAAEEGIRVVRSATAQAQDRAVEEIKSSAQKILGDVTRAAEETQQAAAQAAAHAAQGSVSLAAQQEAARAAGDAAAAAQEAAIRAAQEAAARKTQEQAALAAEEAAEASRQTAAAAQRALEDAIGHMRLQFTHLENARQALLKATEKSDEAVRAADDTLVEVERLHERHAVEQTEAEEQQQHLLKEAQDAVKAAQGAARAAQVSSVAAQKDAARALHAASKVLDPTAPVLKEELPQEPQPFGAAWQELDEEEEPVPSNDEFWARPPELVGDESLLGDDEGALLDKLWRKIRSREGIE